MSGHNLPIFKRIHEVRMTRTPQTMMDVFFVFHWLERPLTQFERVRPYEILVFPTKLYFFRQNEIILRGKSILAFSQLMIGKSRVFSTPCLCICVDIRKYVQGGHICPTPGANRVKVHIALAFPKFSMTKKRTILRF